MAQVIRMPEVFAGSSEAALSSWLVQAGDHIEVGTPLAEIETDKANVEYAAETAGIIGTTLVVPGDSVSVGAPILVLLQIGEAHSEIQPFLDALSNDRPTPVSATDEKADSIELGHQVEVMTTSDQRLFASPIARRIARDAAIDLNRLRGTGPAGRITRRDVEASMAARPMHTASVVAQSTEPGQPATGRQVSYEEIPHSGMRRAIARRLTESKSTVPHFYLTAECRVDELFAVRARINETSTTRISVNDLIVKAVAGAFVEVPEANVTWTDSAMLRHRAVDISIAVATQEGLYTPVVRAVETLTISALSQQISELATRATERRLRQHELEGGSFCVTNLGMYGTLEFSAILNPPQSGILAVGAANQQPVVADGALSIAKVMRFTLSVDHRAIDGAMAATWLAAFTQRIENPLSLLV
ncbi:2-oxo acid dehydrogenase subunit E2 [Cryobacterium suzukii]|uniref:Dihydrolipoamide acetyltransferase component of pyruvate dehydrogenase complex n=1 Tax=Cryobacterium suzukii TaxID=1259198 RepID=A0A4R9AHX7_9MICO|nr:dihydrolipoamide acetyltransferase family protein [Cryobacterium suzukii]TFD62588.1 2-oxo acid dehydrogenase subunit E2 [Cryobacterium suzukii]